MPKQKQKDKKKSNKELEAERLEEERLKREAIEKEQEMKFGIQSFLPDERVPMLLTQWFTKECWNHDSPRKFTRTHLLGMFERLGVDRLIRDDEIDMFSNSIIYNLIHAKDTMKLNDEKACYFVNLMFFLFINKDKRFDVDYFFVGDKVEEEEEDEEDKKKKGNDKKKGKKTEEDEEDFLVDEEDEFDREEIKVDAGALGGKSYEEDLKGFKVLVSKVVKNNLELFSKQQIARIVAYSIDNYFNNFKLFNYCQTHEQTQENIYLQVSIDEPSIPEPLSSAKFLGKIMTAEEIEAERLRKIAEEEDIERAALEEKRRLEEQARKEYEQWLGLDEETIQMIKDKLAETKGYMMQRVEEKKAEYEEKAANSKAFKKKKR